LNKPVGSVLVNNHRQITNRWLQLSRIAADVKKHNAYLDSLRVRSRDYAAILQTSSHTAVTLRERVRGVLVAIEGLESSANTRDAERMNAYLHLLNEVAANATQEAEVIAKRQEQLMADIMSDAQTIAHGARRAHTRSSLFAVSALGALAAGVVLTVRVASSLFTPFLSFSSIILLCTIGRSWPLGGRYRSNTHSYRRRWNAHWTDLRRALGCLRWYISLPSISPVSLVLTVLSPSSPQLTRR
jgi:hypothetical protein